MGKIASKIWSKGFLGGFGIPEMQEALRPLSSWSRSDLIDAYQHFLNYGDDTVDRHKFTDVFQCFADTLTADAAFLALKPKKGRIMDGNTVFAAAVATSNQSFISKVSLIFSIFDTNGDSTLNKDEFTVALRSLLNGLRLFYTDAVLPSEPELEVAINQCFARIDRDGSGLLTLGEFIVYSYRTRELQEMIETVPTEDNRVFEDLVPFQRRDPPPAGDDPFDGGEVRQTRSMPEEPVTKRLSLQDGPMSARTGRRQRSLQSGTTSRRFPGRPPADAQGTWCGSVAYAKRRKRPTSSLRPSRVWSMPPDVSKAQAWLLWKFFHHLSGHNSDVDIDTVLDFLKDEIAVRKELLRITALAKSDEPLKGEETATSLDEKPVEKEGETARVPTAASLALSGSDFVAEVETLSAHFHRILTDPQVRKRLEWLQPCPMTLRAFLCLSFSSLNPTNIECIVGWCNAFRALEVLKTLLTSEAIAVSESEIEVVLEYVDADGSGDLSLSELVLGGRLTKSQAEELFQKCRRKNDAAISDKDLRSYIKGLSMAPGKDMKGVLEVFAHRALAELPGM